MGDLVMGIAKKGRNAFDFDGDPYVWWVAEDYEVFSPGTYFHANICKDDKSLLVTYQLGQDEATSHLVIKNGDPPGPWRRLRCPLFGTASAFTPRNVRQLLEWFRDHSQLADTVNYLGLKHP
ncbi:hypothetical protein [Rubripirellula tenax]|uniref:hypothetical protein n=1 Tax=Rubripirellula tenax TaxID=2528015 RepID=UPI001C94118B|nr:hypothetical protein [Rubripirellula tenax]